MKTTPKRYKLTDSGFWPAWYGKILFTLISVKVWGLVASMAVSTWLLLIHHRSEPWRIGGMIIEHGINGAQWVTFNTTVWALIYGMKEIFKIAEHKDIRRTRLIRSRQEQNAPPVKKIIPPKTRTDPEEFHSDLWVEKVGSEPEEKCRVGEVPG
jgi:hypothetical protein